MHSAPEYVPPPPKKWTDTLAIPKLDYSAFFDADLGKFPYAGARARMTGRAATLTASRSIAARAGPR